MANTNDIAAQLAVNDTNYMLASILLELRTMNIILLQGLSVQNEVGDIRDSLTISDFAEQSS